MREARSRVTPARVARWVAVGTAVLFLALGVAGFVPGVTTGLEALSAAGPGSGAALFGVSQVSLLHNLVRLLAGLAGLIAARERYGVRYYLLIGGWLAVGAAVWGLVLPDGAPANLLPSDLPADLLYLAVGLGMIIAGRVAERPRAKLARRPARSTAGDGTRSG